MLDNLDVNLFSNNEYLLNNLNYCLKYVKDLKINLTILKNCSKSDIPEDVGQWLAKREVFEENIQKLLINAKEEWRSVLTVVPQLMPICLDIFQMSQPREQIFDMALHFLRSLSLCINPKRMTRYWPTEVQWLLKVTEWLEEYLSKYSASKDFDSTTVLILWLASAVKTPFDLSKFDQSYDRPLASRIADIIEKNIGNYSLYPVVHLLAGSYYSRPDCYCQLLEFINKVSSNLSPSSSVNSKLCSLRIIATLLKAVDRYIMLECVDQIVSIITVAIDKDHEQCVKLCMKICGRAALVHLKPSEHLKWRYRCGKRVIKLMYSTSNGQTMMDDKKYEDDDVDFDINLPDYFEDLIHILLTNLVHKSTVVRFSVAKYLASIGCRLPYQYSDQMLEHIFKLCDPMEDDNYWHGACLAIAEFVRRGYVQIESMQKVIKILDQALFFEQIKGSFSSGTQVRDAACYICWSMARAYDGQLISRFVVHLAPILLNVACFDREVNCRRAASAVIQELAGRTQQFPHWIDVIQRTEFHELSQIEHSYVDIGVHFATVYPEFCPSIVENLLFKKCIHWDPSIRRLAAKTIAKISIKCPFFNQTYFEKFFKSLKNLNQSDLNHRHGRIIMISYMLNEDKSLQQPPIIQEVFEIFKEQSLTLQSICSPFSINLIRESLLLFIEKCFPLLEKDTATLEKIYSFLFESIQSNESNELIQSKTIDALLSLIGHIDNDSAEQFLYKMISLITNSDHFIVSTLAKFFTRYIPTVGTTIEKILSELNEFLDKWFDEELRRPETIADIARALITLSTNHKDLFNSQLLMRVHENILKCLDDHSTTKKGDTGLPVRQASIEIIYPYVCRLDSKQLEEIFRLIASEAASHRNRTFLISMTQLIKISTDILMDSKYQVFKNLNLNQISLSELSSSQDLDLYQECIKMFQCSELIPDLWRGFICVLADPILNKYSKLIIDYIKNATNQSEILKHFLCIATTKSKCQRLSIPCLISGHLLLTQILTTSEFQDNIAKFAWMACERTSNPKKYLLASDIFCTLLSLGKIHLVVGYLFVLLGHRLPRVRSYTSIQMYTAILSLDIDNDEQILNEISTLLQQTDWFDLNEAKRERERIRTLIKSL